MHTKCEYSYLLRQFRYLDGNSFWLFVVLQLIDLGLVLNQPPEQERQQLSLVPRLG